MGRNSFLLDLVWLIAVGAVLVLGDYRRRDDRMDRHAEIKIIQTWVRPGQKTSHASLGLPTPAIERHTF